jgi:hypothetical protein
VTTCSINLFHHRKNQELNYEHIYGIILHAYGTDIPEEEKLDN